MPGYRRVATRDERRSKTMDLAPAELSAPDPRQVLRKRLDKEMDALRGILRKAELMVGKDADKGRDAPRRGKNRRFLAEEARSEATEVDRTPCAKRRKTTPPVKKMELPRISKADPIPCAKRRKTPPVEIIEARISQGEIFSLVNRLSSFSSNMPVRIVEFLNKECTGHTDQKAGEMEIDLGSMRRSAMFELQKLLDEFAEEEKRQKQKEESIKVCRSTSRSSPGELEEGEFVEEAEIVEEGELIEEDCGATATTGTCSCDASPVVARKGLCSPPLVLKDGEMIEEEGVICGPVDAAIAATSETARSPSNSSSSSSSDGSSGSSCSDSSCSDSSDSGSDDECVTSNVAPAVLPIPKADASAIAILEDGEMIEEEEEEVDICGDIATEKFVETAKSPSSNSSSSSLSGSSSSSSSSSSGSSCSDSSDSGSSDSGSDDECVTSNSTPAVLPKTDTSPMAMPNKVLSPITEEEFAETRNSRRSNSSLLEDGEIEEEQESRGASPMAAKKFAETMKNAGSTNGQHVRSSRSPGVRPEPSKPQPAAQGTVGHFYAKSFEKKRERATAAQGTVGHLYAKAFEKKCERQRAYEELEEMERNAKAKPIFDWMDPRHLRQLGITTPVEYAVTSERCLPARRGGCPLQSLLGLFLKAE